MKIKLPYIILIFFVCSLSKSLAQNSVLSKGNWVKIGVINSGVYKLDASFLQKVGFDIAQINPRNIKIYGNGGGMLPQSNMITRPKDLIENAISVEGETDEKFDSQDFILFYGQSPHAINYDSLSKSFSHQFNIYSDTTFYFLTVSDTKGLRIKDQDSVSATQEIVAFDDYVFHEIDRKNILAQAPFAGSGREWVGEEFTGNVEQVFPFNQTGIIPNLSLKIKASIAAAAFGQTEFMIKANGLSVGNVTLNAIGEDRYDYKGAFSSKSFTINPDFTNTSDLKIGLTYNRKSLSSGVGYLNFLGIQTVRNLKLYGNQTIFRSIESLQYQTVKFSLNETNINFKIWDISTPAQAQNQLYTLQNQKLSFGVSTSTLKDFIVFNNTNFLDPVSFSKINNQNLQPLETPDLLIVTSESLRKQANRLADFRRQNDKLSVEVVSTQEIYNEFASGKQDISAIRDL